jgi:hypothetical protein
MSWKYDDDPAEVRGALAIKLSREFKEELQQLLIKWGAEIEAEDHYKGWPECGEDVRMTASFQHPDAGYVSIDLGRHLDGGV